MKIKPFGCFICKRRFTMKQNRDTHMRTHGSHHAFNCTICGRSYSMWGKLQTHRLRQHNMQERCCNFCGVAFENREEHEMHFAQCEKRMALIKGMGPCSGSADINENGMKLMEDETGREASAPDSSSGSSSRGSSSSRGRAYRKGGTHLTARATSKKESSLAIQQPRLGSTGSFLHRPSGPHNPQEMEQRRRPSIAMINEVNLIATSPIASALPNHRDLLGGRQQHSM
mmetsp:Transcript_27372/g.38193  ORF Transcript_27372/g.38193 Transcript_27372/m.38193 type:complete len:228 (-) Transcript_27372:21-704(-)